MPGEAAQRSRSSVAVTSAQVRLHNGKTIKLSPPISLRGGFRSSRLTIRFLYIASVDRITAAGGAPDARSYSIRLRDGTTIGRMKADRRTSIRGKGSWGSERIPLSRIASIELKHSRPMPKSARKPVWRATMRDGSTLSVVPTRRRGRARVRGKLGRTVMDVYADRVKQIDFRGGRAKVLAYDDRIIAEGWRPRGLTLRSHARYGIVRIKWSQIRTLESVIVKPPAAPKSVYRITLADGRTAHLHGVRVGGFSAWVMGALFRFKRGPINGLTRSADGKSAKLTMADGRTLQATDIRKRSRFSISAEDGRLSGAWRHVTKIERIKAEPYQPRQFETQWRLKTKQGLALRVRFLRTYKGRLARKRRIRTVRRRRPDKPTTRRKASGIVARRLNWQAASEVKTGPDGLRIIFGEKTWISLNGAITAQSRYGRVVVPAKSVESLTRIEGTHIRSGANYGRRTVGALASEDGREFKVQSIAFQGGRRAHRDKRFWGYDLLITRVPPVEFWSSIDTLLARGVTHDQAGRVLGRPFLGADPVPLTGVRGLRFSSAAGSFFMPAALIGPYRPMEETAAPPSFSARFRLRVHGRTAKGGPYDVAFLSFARYPRRGYSGVYTRSSYPFQWHRSRRLLFRREDTGSQLAIDLRKLRRIELIGRYTRGRRASVTNRQGDTITGAIYPGSRRRGRGVSRWNSRKEGLLGRLSDGSFLFVRFKDVARIDIEHLEKKD